MPIRIDKYLWAVRLYKTRSIATDAVKNGKVMIGGTNVKPSRTISKGDQFEIKAQVINRKFLVKEELNNRVGAKLVADYITEITPGTELEKLEMHRKMQYGQRNRGTGRPTKKERREMDDFYDGWSDWELDDEDDLA